MITKAVIPYNTTFRGEMLTSPLRLAGFRITKIIAELFLKPRKTKIIHFFMLPKYKTVSSVRLQSFMTIISEDFRRRPSEDMCHRQSSFNIYAGVNRHRNIWDKMKFQISFTHRDYL